MDLKMNHQNWHHMRIKLKQKYPELTLSDLYDRGGEEDELIQMVAHKLKKSTLEMRNIISKL